MGRLVNPTVYIYNLDVSKHDFGPHLPYTALGCIGVSNFVQMIHVYSRYLLKLKSL